MRREVLLGAANRIISDLKNAGIPEMMENYMHVIHQGAKEKEKIKFPLDAFKKYMLSTASYSKEERAICDILNISPLLDMSLWEKFSTDPAIEVIWETKNNVDFTITHLPKILELLKQEYVTEVKEQTRDLPEELHGKILLTVYLGEAKGQYSSPSRLVHLFEAMTVLYGVFATLENQSEIDLLVLACDSGSDKSFDFLGLAKLMEQVKEIILAIWDRRVLYRHMQASECISLIAKSLPVLQKIEELKVTGALGPEQAEILKRKIIDGATKFLEAGATIAEMELETAHSPKALMRPEQKLLAAPLSTEVTASDRETMSEKSDQNISASEKMTPEELKQFELLLIKAKGQVAPSKPSSKRKSQK